MLPSRPNKREKNCCQNPHAGRVAPSEIFPAAMCLTHATVSTRVCLRLSAVCIWGKALLVYSYVSFSPSSLFCLSFVFSYLPSCLCGLLSVYIFICLPLPFFLFVLLYISFILVLFIPPSSPLFFLPPSFSSSPSPLLVSLSLPSFFPFPFLSTFSNSWIWSLSPCPSHLYLILFSILSEGYSINVD